MKLITKETDYAVRALICILKKPSQVHTAVTLSHELKIPKPFLRTIMQQMAAAGLVSSTKGKGGGFTSAKSAKDLTLIEIMQVFQGNFSVIDCMFRKKLCDNRNNCILRSNIKGIEQDIQKRLAGITLKKLMKG